MNDDPTAIASEVFAHVERAWNDGDGARLAEPFSADVDFVDIRGAHHRGSVEVAHGHQAILDSIYKGSTVRYTVIDAESIAEGCLLAHVQATLEAPAGPLQGTNHSLISAIFIHGADGWKVRAFHNTLIAR